MFCRCVASRSKYCATSQQERTCAWLNWSSWAYPLCLSIKGTIWKPHHSAPECCNVFHNHNTTNLNFHYQMQWNVRWGWTQEQIYLVVIYLTEKYLWLCTCDGMYTCIHNGSEGCWDTRTQAGTYWLCLHINIERHGTLVCSLFDFSPLCVDGTYGCVSTLTSRDTALCLRSPFLYCSRLPAIVLQNFSWAICFKLIVKDFFHPQQKCFNVICDLMDGWQLP